MTDANAAVARLICQDLVATGLIPHDRRDLLERKICDGTIKAEDWNLALEAAPRQAAEVGNGIQAG